MRTVQWLEEYPFLVEFLLFSQGFVSGIYFLFITVDVITFVKPQRTKC